MKSDVMKKVFCSQIEQFGQMSKRAVDNGESIISLVRDVIDRVKVEGDVAIREMTKRYDGVIVESLKVDPDSFCSQLEGKKLMEAIDIACENIYKFHKAQMPSNISVETSPGVLCMQRYSPIDRVGLYIPGGTAPLFSTLLMLAIPAKIAGCKEIVLCTPPQKNGKIDQTISYVARKLGIEEVYLVGGAQAIAALALGTETIAPVKKIFGPGNQFVAVAKQMLSNIVAIDMIAGPSELLIIADSTANPVYIAADLISQAEHGPDSQVILLTTSDEIADKVNEELLAQLKNIERKDIALQSLSNGFIAVVDSLDSAFEMSNSYAPEHLIVVVEDEMLVNKITAAGSVFIGSYSSESFGDYASGTNHTLPTSGWASSQSGVDLLSFLKRISYQKVTKEGFDNLATYVERMAQAEGLTGHRVAVSIRKN